MTEEPVETVGELLSDLLLRADSIRDLVVAWRTGDGRYHLGVHTGHTLVGLGLAARLLDYLNREMDEKDGEGGIARRGEAEEEP